MSNQTNLLCEQGDMGLWSQPLKEQDQKVYDQQQQLMKNNQKETQADE